MDHIHPYFIVYSFIALEYIIGKLGVFNFLRLLVCIGACWWVAMTAQAVAQRHTANRFVTQISLNDSRSRVRRAASVIDLPAQDGLRSPVLRLTATQMTGGPLIQATRETKEPQPSAPHQAEESQPLVPRQGEELPQGEEPHQDEESHQGKESQQPAPRQGKEPHPPALWWSMELTPPTSWLPLEPGELSPRPPSSFSLLLASIFKTPWMPKEAHRKVDGKWLRVMESPSGAFIAWPVMKGWDLRRQFRFSPEAEALADQAHNRAASQAPAPLAGAGQRDMAITSASLGTMLAEVFSPDMVHSDYWNFSSAGGQYREWSVDPVNLDPRLLACYVAKHLVAKLPWQYLLNCGAVEDLYMAMQYCDMVARGALLFYGDKEHHAGERHADNQPAEPTTAIVTVASGETTSAPLSNSDRDDPSSITGVPSSEPLTTRGQSAEPVSADGATECADADVNSVVTVAQPLEPAASIGGSSSESPTSNTSDDTVHTCVAGKVAEDDGLRCESPAGNVAIGLRGVLPASNTSDEAGAAHGTNVNNTPPKVRRNSAPAVATEAAGQSARRRASSSNGVVTPAPTVQLDEPVSTALVATQAPTVAEASKGVAEPTVMCTVVRSAMPHPGRSNKRKEAEVVDAASTTSSSEPSGSGSRVVVNIPAKPEHPVATSTVVHSANPHHQSFMAEQAVGPVTNGTDSMQPKVPSSNSVRSGGEVAMQAGEPYVSSDVGHGAMLIDASSQQGEPSATDGVLQDVELPAMDMVMQDVEPPTADMAVEDAELPAATMSVEGAEPFVADAEMLSIASTSHVVVPPATDMVVEYVEPPAADMAVVGAEPFVVDAAMQDAEKPNVASTSRVVVPPTAVDVEMEAAVPAVPDMEVEERPLAANDAKMAEEQQPANLGYEAAEPPVVGDVGMDDDSSDSDQDIVPSSDEEMEVHVPLLDTKAVNAKMTQLGRTFSQPRRRRPLSVVASTLPPNPGFLVPGAIPPNFANSSSRATINVPVFSSGLDAMAWINSNSGVKAYPNGQVASGPLPEIGQAGVDTLQRGLINREAGNTKLSGGEAAAVHTLLGLSSQGIAGNMGNAQLASTSGTQPRLPNPDDFEPSDDEELDEELDDLANEIEADLMNDSRDAASNAGGNAQLVDNTVNGTNLNAGQANREMGANDLLNFLNSLTSNTASQPIGQVPQLVPPAIPAMGSTGADALQFNINGMVATDNALLDNAPGNDTIPPGPLFPGLDNLAPANPVADAQAPGCDFEAAFQELNRLAALPEPAVPTVAVPAVPGLPDLGTVAAPAVVPAPHVQGTGVVPAVPAVAGPNGQGAVAEAPANNDVDFDALLHMIDTCSDADFARLCADLEAQGIVVPTGLQVVPSMVTAPTTPATPAMNTGAQESGGSGSNV